MVPRVRISPYPLTYIGRSSKDAMEISSFNQLHASVQLPGLLLSSLALMRGDI
ncbi:MAG: hypothetical protein J6P06_02695 [Aeriscardovia sp.]|nr:hypothetical protein [Aeriscardovia sp.]